MPATRRGRGRRPLTPELESFEAAIAAVDSSPSQSVVATSAAFAAVTSAAANAAAANTAVAAGLSSVYTGSNVGPPVKSPGAKVQQPQGIHERIMTWRASEMAMGKVTPSEVKGTHATPDIMFFYREMMLPTTDDLENGPKAKMCVCMVCE